MEGSYRPQSPDLSSFYSSPAKAQPPYHQSPPPVPPTSSYAPRSPVIPPFNTYQAPTSNVNHHAYSTLHHSANQQPQTHQPYPNPPYPGYNPGNAGVGPPSNPRPSFDSREAINAPYQIPGLPPQHSFASAPESAPIPSYYTPQQYPEPPTHFRSEDSTYSAASTEAYIASPSNPTSSPFAMSRHGAKMLTSQPPQPDFGFPPPQHQQQQYKDPNPNNIEIKTKFPVARIKRIMQADEEVGKVAQVTPVAVSKALELFMIALVSGAAEKAKEKGGKRVTAQHLKQVVLGSPEQFDFLQEIVGRVVEAPEGEGARKRKGKGGQEEASESSDEEAAKVKRKGKGGRRKKSEE